MTRLGVAVHEEAVRDELLACLTPQARWLGYGLGLTHAQDDVASGAVLKSVHGIRVSSRGVFASIDSPPGEVMTVSAVSIRNLDDRVKERLRLRAARHGRSMEAEMRAILTEAVSEPGEDIGLFQALLDKFGQLGGVELDVPARTARPRAADLG